MRTPRNTLSLSRMRRMTAGWAMLVAMFLLPGTASSQCGDKTTQGKDFWLMFMTNEHVGNSTFSLIAACDTATTITVSNPRTSWSQVVTLNGPGSITIPIPSAQAYTNELAVVSNGGIHVTSTQPIALYASNFQVHDHDIATIFPSSVLQTHYMVQTYSGAAGRPEVGFVALHDSTVISMTLPIPSETLPAGPHTVTLMHGESYQLRCYTYNWGGYNYAFSGMEVTSNGKPFAMFQGSGGTDVGGCSASSHLYEQCYPTNFWGNHFLLIPSAGRSSGDLIIVTSRSDNCQLTLDGTFQTTLMAGESWQFDLAPNTVKFLESSQPVTTCLYLKGEYCDNNMIGEPASVIIPPIEQRVESCIFQAINTPYTTLHYANIAVPSYDVDSVKLDGQSVGSHFHAHPSGFSYAQLSITPGTHTLSNSPNGFVAHFYGLGSSEGHAYIAGSAIRDLSGSLFLDTIEVRNHTGQIHFCQGDTVTLSVESDESDLIVEWIIDSELVALADAPFHHVFDTPGSHLIQARYHLCDTLETTVDIMPSYLFVDIDTTCFNQPYCWRDHTLDSTGLYVDSLLSFWGCDSLFTLHLFVIPMPQTSFAFAEDCHTATYTLAATLAEARGWPFHWSSQPHDTTLDGHAADTSVIVKPLQPTRYTLHLDYRCPFTVDTLLQPIEWPGAAWEVHPDLLSYSHPWFDAYDRSLYETRRQWLVDRNPLAETGDHLHYTVPFEADSVELMLVVSNSSCDDTLRHTLPFVHSVAWAPNVFSPAADGGNRFAVVLDDAVADELLIYNRHGILVRRLPGPNPLWDGTASDGTPCPQGAYVWLLRYRSDDQPARLQTLTGTVTLLR